MGSKGDCPYRGPGASRVGVPRTTPLASTSPESTPMPADQTLTEAELQTLEHILAKLDGRQAHLPYPLFRFITEVAATANIDLVVHNEAGKPSSPGEKTPPAPAGTCRAASSATAKRSPTVSRPAPGTSSPPPSASTTGPIALIQIFDDRGHSLSLCYRATLNAPPGKPVITEQDAPKPGDLRWFATPPQDLYPSHRVYRDLLTDLTAGRLASAVPLYTQHTGHRDAAPTQGGIITADAPLTE